MPEIDDPQLRRHANDQLRPLAKLLKRTDQVGEPA